MQRILAGHELKFVKQYSEALSLLREEFGLVVVGVHFDDSQMFPLLAGQACSEADPRRRAS